MWILKKIFSLKINFQQTNLNQISCKLEVKYYSNSIMKLKHYITTLQNWNIFLLAGFEFVANLSIPKYCFTFKHITIYHIYHIYTLLPKITSYEYIVMYQRSMVQVFYVYRCTSTAIASYRLVIGRTRQQTSSRSSPSLQASSWGLSRTLQSCRDTQPSPGAVWFGTLDQRETWSYDPTWRLCT